MGLGARAQAPRLPPPPLAVPTSKQQTPKGVHFARPGRQERPHEPRRPCGASAGAIGRAAGGRCPGKHWQALPNLSPGPAAAAGPPVAHCQRARHAPAGPRLGAPGRDLHSPLGRGKAAIGPLRWPCRIRLPNDRNGRSVTVPRIPVRWSHPQCRVRVNVVAQNVRTVRCGEPVRTDAHRTNRTRARAKAPGAEGSFGHRSLGGQIGVMFNAVRCP